MTATNLTCNIAGTVYPVLNGSYTLDDKIDEHSTVSFTIYDASGTHTFQYGQAVTITDTLEGLKFAGFITKSTATKYPANTAIAWAIDCIDNHFITDRRTSNMVVTNQYAGVAAAKMVNDYLSGEGVTANYAIRDDNTQTEFGQGTLSGTASTSNLGGDLELAPAGSTVTITESTTSAFGSGSLTDMTASNNTLGPSSTATLKVTAKQSVAGITNSYSYVKIFSSGGISIISGRYLAYDIWISSTSPEAKIGVDIVFTDGTTLRDNSQYNDAQYKAPHPGTDLAGYAVDQWYHRKFLLDNLTSKTISYITVGIEGDKQGIYTGYIKNIYEVDVDDNIINTFFAGSLDVFPPQQMQKQGYSSTSVTVVNTYDCNTANRVSSSYSIDAAKILRSSFLTYKTTLPTGYTFNLSYSIDGGNSYTPITSNNAILPNLPSGLSIASKSIQFLQSFTQGAGADPTQQPLLNSMQAVLYSSYSATKTDINAEFTTHAQWNTSGTSFSNTNAPSNILMPYGAVRNWDDAYYSNQNLYGGGATGINTSTSCSQYVDSGQFRIFVYQSTEARSRLDFCGQWQNFQMEFDADVDNANMRVGCVWRTTGWSNYDSNYAYCVQIYGTTINVKRASNSSQTTTGTSTQIATATIALSSQVVHRIKVVVNGSTHTIYIDDVQFISVTDSTYSATGYVGLRVSNADASNGYIALFDNFGISPTSLGGYWTSQSISLTGAGTYGGSVVQWLDVSTDPAQVSNTVQSSTNGGSTWQTLTNGGSIPSLTLGQSLSGVSLKFKINFSANSSIVLPMMQYLTAYVLGGFSSSGTRIAPVLSLANAGIAGSTVVNWTATTPANTSITVATSLNGSSWTNVSNGDPIAGITAQAAGMLDTFTADDHTSYTHAQRTGGSAGTWTWDTTNSRLSVSGGTNDMQLWTAISTANIDIVLDIDQADRCGIVWRQTDASNFYELDIYDGSSSAGLTNVMQLYKVVSNVKTQLGSNTAITLPRGYPKRFRVIMNGTAITVYFEGTSIISTTDSSLSSAGKAGIIEVSGIGRFYNLRLQPLGQSLSGINAYTKVTLTSSDPTATPQLTDLTLAALHPSIGLGSLVTTADYTNTYLSSNFDDLAKKSDTYYWLIDQNLKFIFADRVASPAPWILQSTDQTLLLAGPLTVEYSGDLYRNRHTVTGVNATGVFSETKIGDGTATSWALGNNVAAVPTVTLNGQPQTVGLKGIDTGKNFYYEIGNNTIYQDSSNTVLQSSDFLGISYTGQYITSVTVDNTSITGTTTQSQFASIAGGTGIVEVVEDMSSQNLDIATATDHCTAMLTRYGVIGRTLTFNTYRSNPSLSVGQYLPVFIPEHSINDAAMLITSIATTQKISSDSGSPTQIYFSAVTACEAANIGSGWKLLASTLN